MPPKKKVVKKAEPVKEVKKVIKEQELSKDLSDGLVVNPTLG